MELQLQKSVTRYGLNGNVQWSLMGETPTSSGRYIKPQEKWAPSCDWLDNDSLIGYAII